MPVWGSLSQYFRKPFQLMMMHSFENARDDSGLLDRLVVSASPWEFQEVNGMSTTTDMTGCGDCAEILRKCGGDEYHLKHQRRL